MIDPTIGAALAGQEALEVRGGEVAFLKVGIVQNPLVERDRRFDPVYHEFVEGTAHSGHGFMPVAPMGDDFGDH